MSAPQVVLDLVDRFHTHIDAYKNVKYNETQLRREFLDPFFKALGWDVDNEQGYAEAYKDVVHEDAIKVGGATKAPDYSFRIGGQRKFFVEAKKPSVNIKSDFAPAFQLRRYAWSSKLPLSIVSDFEELAVYDCRNKPLKTDKSSTGRTLYITYDQYVERWDEIAGIFSREAILKGSFDTYAESHKAKRGTSEVDAVFLSEIERWRELLARNIALRNATLTTRELNYAVQKTIDRLIFLRICEDRGIENYGRLQQMLKGVNIYERLKQLFYDADARYNSGLFHFKLEKGIEEPADTLTLDLKIDDNSLKDILKHLYYPDSPYEFSVLPADILGQVYEQFLGKVIRLTSGHQAKVEEKPEVRKAGGVFYTPTYIVDYIVNNTVGKLVEGMSPKQVEAITIIDPACGSGSFLLGAYQFLLDWHLNQYSCSEFEKHSKGKNPKLYQDHTGSWRLTTSERKRILLSNIYGVDIDAQAVEVTKLSLLLKVLEGETGNSLKSQMMLFHERALPNLSSNIKCGNSLIGADFYDGQQLELLDEEEQYRINLFDWEKEFRGVFKTGGFSAVIGNPPYGASFTKVEKDYLCRKFPNQSYQLDSYLVFLEKAMSELLSKGGFFGMIIPNPWLSNLLQEKLRKFIIENFKITEISHFNYKVWKKVTVDTQIVIFEKNIPKSFKSSTKIFPTLQSFYGQNFISIEHKQDNWNSLDGAPINIFLTDVGFLLAEKIRKKSRPLETLLEINVGIKPYQINKGKPPQTKDVVKNRVFDSETAIDCSYRKYLRGKDIKKYCVAPLKDRFIKYGQWLAEPRPSINFDVEKKIVMRQTGDSIVAALDTQKFLCLNNMHVLVNKKEELSLSFLLGLINSKLLNWYYQTLNPEVGEALAEVKKTNVAKLPIHTIDFNDPLEKAQYERIADLTDKIIALNKQLILSKASHDQTLLQRQINATDRQIDKVVYELYELTEDEIIIVEGPKK